MLVFAHRRNTTQNGHASDGCTDGYMFHCPPPHSLSYLKGWNVKVSVTSCALINLIGSADGGGGMASRWNALTDGRKDGRREKGRRTDEDEVRGRVGI